MARGKRRNQEKPEFEWPEPNKELYPDKPCECGGVAEHNGFPGEYWCSGCETGFWEPA